MKSASAIICLNALGQEQRLKLFRLLVQAGDEGMYVGELTEATGLSGAILIEHLHALRRAGMVRHERHGRAVRCRANYARMNELLGFLTENCCAGSVSSSICGPDAVCIPVQRKP
jgi:ArsR family transcriptional regulator, arsenate/arsenite/antimonite-responsive transcriptional repressor